MFEYVQSFVGMPVRYLVIAVVALLLLVYIYFLFLWGGRLECIECSGKLVPKPLQYNEENEGIYICTVCKVEHSAEMIRVTGG